MKCSYALLTLSLCAGASAQYLNVTEGPPIRYNDTGYGLLNTRNTGMWDNGDTHASAWMDNGKELITYNDGTDPTPVSVTGVSALNFRNIGLTVMNAGDYTSLAHANTMDDYGGGSAVNVPNGWTDYRTWKTSGIAPYNGCVYLTVQRQEDYDTTGSPPNGIAQSVFNGFRNGSSTIVKSCDHGATWLNPWNSTPSAGGNPPQANQAMWYVGVRWYGNTLFSSGTYVLDSNGHNQRANNAGRTCATMARNWSANGGPTSDCGILWTDEGPAIAGFVPVTYCQDNTINCPATGRADNFTSGSYIYLTAMGAGDTNMGSYTNYYLARVPKSQIANTGAGAQYYEYWVGQPGGDISSSSNWSNTMIGAQPIINVTGFRSQIYWLDGVSSYVLVQDNAQGSFEFWIASNLTGPWIKTGYTKHDQAFAQGPSILMDTVTTINASPATVEFLIEYSGCADSNAEQDLYPEDQSYSSIFKQITLTASPTSAVTANAAAFSDFVPKSNLLVDLAFLPELGNTITDYSGNGNNATGSYTATHTLGSNYADGIWFNVENPGNSAVTGQYSVSVPVQVTGPFTLYVAYRKLQAPNNNECIVQGSSISICRSGTNRDDWLINVNGAVTEWSDSSTFNGVYYNTGYDGSWNMFVVNYNGTQVYTYNQYSIFRGPYPNIPGPSRLNASSFTLGGQGFSGEIARFLLYNTSHDGDAVRATANAVIADLSARKIYLARDVRSGEFVLDSQGVPFGAWSVRKLLTSWGFNPLVNLQNVTDGRFQDIGTDASGNLDATAVNNFCGSFLGNCVLAKWYDQSGHGNTLSINSLGAHAVHLTTCPPNNTYCFYDDGYESFATPNNNFFLYSFTVSANAVMAVDAAASNLWGTYMTFFDYESDPNTNPALFAPASANSSYKGIHWAHTGNGPDLPISNQTLFTVWSWFDSYTQSFFVNNTPLGAQTVANSSNEVRIQAYGFELGNINTIGGPYAAGWFSEAMIWDQAFSAGNIREISANESAYFGIGN